MKQYEEVFMRIRLVVALLLTAAAATPVSAAEGRFPVWTATSITEPGHYILTQDVTASSGPVVSILADGVTLDLNGHTIRTTDASQPVILIGGAAGSENGIIVIDGKVEGGRHGILYQAPPDDGTPLVLEDLTIAGSADAAVKGVGFSQISAKGITIVNSLVGFDLQASAPGTPPPPVPPSARIREAQIRGAGGIHCTGVVCSLREISFELDLPGAATPMSALRFSDATGGEAVGIIIINSLPSASSFPIVDVLGVCWLTLTDLTIVGPAIGTQPCIHMDPASRDFIIRNSVLSRCGGDGIRSEGINGVLKGNLVSGSANGIFAGGSNMIIDDGDLSGNSGAGIWFASSNHVYRANILRGNTGGGVAGPGASDATNAGGNVE
jgi:Right handed beta helix region